MRISGWLGPIALFATLSPAIGATPITNGSGLLTGATGVDVGGALYDVSFQDGTCAEVFSGCDDAGDFAFDLTTAQVAAQALLDQVFLDVPAGQFDSMPSLTFGCGSGRVCYAFIPTSMTLGAYAGNREGAGLDDIGIDPGLPSDTSGDGQLTWARFTIAEAAIPEPATWAMLVLGFGLIGHSLRLRSRRQLTVPRAMLAKPRTLASA